MRSVPVKAWIIALLLASPVIVCAQKLELPFDRCVYRLGDNPAWAATDVDPAGWSPYTEYQMNGRAVLMWVRCRANLNTNGIPHPALALESDGPEENQIFINGRFACQSNEENIPALICPISPDQAQAEPVIAVRVVQKMLAPGMIPGRPVILSLGDRTSMQTASAANTGEMVKVLLPAYSNYLVIGASGLFLLGLFLFDRSQKAAFWLGIYCCCVCIPRLKVMVSYLYLTHLLGLPNAMYFGLAMLESWALVRVCFAIVQRRIPAVYRLVVAAWIFIFLGAVLPVFLPPRLALPLSLFVEVTCFQPIWCIWGFACTAPFVAFWPWTRLHGRQRIVGVLCAVWAVIEGWFQLQQVFFNRNTWSNQVQNWMSLAVAALVVAILGYIFHEQQIVSGERAELRGELAAARQVQHLLIPGKTGTAAGVMVNAAFMPAHDVGGDFYLFRALRNGAQRVLLGDVSGKGVAAALTSALLLGAADRCDDLQPSAVLAELNAALRNNSIAGFTTCLCADLLPSGLLIVANAGQLPPYRNGSELDFPPSLPLGVSPVPEYTELSLQLIPGDSLTFLSDGVVEARNSTGELFGFERTRQISKRSAHQIAEEAVAFGQQDDITVLTLSLTPGAAYA